MLLASAVPSLKFIFIGYMWMNGYYPVNGPLKPGNQPEPATPLEPS